MQFLRLLSLTLCAFLLGGCTVNVVDSRLTREEVNAAFSQRDAAIDALAKVIKKLHPEIEKKIHENQKSTK